MWVLTYSHRVSCFISLFNILSNYLTLRPTHATHTSYIMSRFYRSFCGKPGRSITQADKLSVQSKMKHTGNESHGSTSRTEGFRCSLEERNTAFSELGELTSWMWFFSAASLLFPMLECTIGQLRQQGAGHMQLIILICLAPVASHFPTASAETPREGGIGIKIITELWDPSKHH